MQAVNLTKKTVLASALEVAGTGASRSRGLLGRAGLAPGEGMWIVPCESVHTFFMRFPIDLVFLNRRGRIVRIMPSVTPWRLTAPVFGARSVLEIEAGAAQRASSRAGDQVRFEDVA